MSKKGIYSLLFVLVVIACSQDNDDVVQPVVQETTFKLAYKLVGIDANHFIDSFTYSYGDTGRLNSISHFRLGEIVAKFDMKYDNKNNLILKSHWPYPERDRVEIQYNDSGQITSYDSTWRGIHLTKMFEFDDMGRLTSQRNQGGGEVVWYFAMKHDNIGNVESKLQSQQFREVDSTFLGPVYYKYNSMNQIIEIYEDFPSPFIKRKKVIEYNQRGWMLKKAFIYDNEYDWLSWHIEYLNFDKYGNPRERWEVNYQGIKKEYYKYGYIEINK